MTYLTMKGERKPLSSLKYMTFEGCLKPRGSRFFLVIPKYSGEWGRRGPFNTREEAWTEYVRIAAELFFSFTPETPIPLDE